jgi:hypothetical protein
MEAYVIQMSSYLTALLASCLPHFDITDACMIRIHAIHPQMQYVRHMARIQEKEHAPDCLVVPAGSWI